MPPSTFNDKTTAEEAAAHYAASITDKVVLITGGEPPESAPLTDLTDACVIVSQGGLGGEAARVIAKQGATVVLAGRSKEKCVVPCGLCGRR